MFGNHDVFSYRRAAIHVHGDVAANVTDTRTHNIRLRNGSAKDDFASGDPRLHQGIHIVTYILILLLA